MNIFNLDILKAALIAADETEDIDGNTVKQVFLGTVSGLLPSGKYYTPFACSNVTEEEALEDEEWYAKAESELDTIGAYLVSGEGNPCDIFAEVMKE